MSVYRERLLSASVQNPLSPRWRRWSSIPAVAVASVLSASTPAHAADGQYIANNTPAFVAAAKSLGAAAESQRIEVSPGDAGTQRSPVGHEGPIGLHGRELILAAGASVARVDQAHRQLGVGVEIHSSP